MPDSSKYQIGVEIGATGAENFKKQIDDSVKALSVFRTIVGTIPKADLSKSIVGVAELRKQTEDVSSSFKSLSAAFVQPPVVDLRSSVIGTADLRKQTDDVATTFRTLSAAFVQPPTVDLRKSIVGIPEIDRQTDEAAASFKSLSASFIQPPIVDLRRSVVGGEQLDAQIDEASDSFGKLRSTFVQPPKIDLTRTVTGADELKRQTDATLLAFRGFSQPPFTQPPVIDFSQMIAGFRSLSTATKAPLSDVQAFKNSVAQLKKEAAAGVKLNITVPSLDQLRTKLADIQSKISSNTNPALFTRLRAEAAKTQTAISALDKTVATSSQGLNKIGPGAAQAGQSLTNLGRIAQDAPFGFIGIQNNIGPLIDSFGYLSTATRNAGGPLKALAGALTGPAGIGLGIAVVTGLITAAVQKYGSLGNAIDVVFGLTTNLEQANRDLAKSFAESEGSVAGEVANIQSLVAIAGDKALTDATRTEALNKLNKEYDAYLPKLTLETIGTGKAKEAIDALTASLVRQAKVKGAQDLISKATQAQLELGVGSVAEQANILDNVLAGIKTLGSAGQNFKANQIAAGADRASAAYDKLQETVDVYTKALNKMNLEEAKGGTLSQDEKEKPIKKAVDLLGQQISALERIKKVQQEIADIPTLDKKISAIDVEGLTDQKVEELTGKAKIEQALKDVGNLINTSEKLYTLKNIKINADFKKGIIDAATAEDLRKQLRDDLDKVFLQQALIFEGTVRVKPTVIVDRADLTTPEIQSKIAKELGLDKTLPLNYSATIAVQIAGADTRAAMKTLEQIQDEFKATVDNIINDSMQSAAQAIGEGVGNALSGEALKGLVAPFLNVIASAITELGKATIAYGLAMKVVQNALKKAFNNPAVAIAAGIAAVAVGQVLRNKAQKSAPKFEGGGVISGPNSGYPVLLHGTEAIVPLDNNKHPFGVNPGGGNNGLGNIVGVLRGKDINLINRRAETSRRRI